MKSYVVKKGSFQFRPMQILVLVIIIITFPFIVKIIRKIGKFLEINLGFLSGDGGAAAQQQNDLKREAFQVIDKGFDKSGITPTSSDYADAAIIAKWNNAYRGFFQSMVSTNVPHDDQIKVLNLLGFCVPDGEYMYYPSGRKDKLYVNIMNDYNRNVNQYRIAGIIKAYQLKDLPDRQTFIIGFFLDNTEGSLITHIQEFYSKEYADMFLPYLYNIVKNFL